MFGQKFILADNEPGGHGPGCPPLPHAAIPIVPVCPFG